MPVCGLPILDAGALLSDETEALAARGAGAPVCASAAGGMARLRHSTAISARLGRFGCVTRNRLGDAGRLKDGNALIVLSVGRPVKLATGFQRAPWHFLLLGTQPGTRFRADKMGAHSK